VSPAPSKIDRKESFMKSRLLLLSLAASGLVACMVPQGKAQSVDGEVALHISPKQTYVWVDGRAISEASKHHRLSLSAGDHKIELANYGYTPETRNVTITPGATTDLAVNLQPVFGSLSGPFGAMTIEGADRDAILLNGKTPGFFVGHGDEFDHEWIWKQELVIPPGTYQVYVQRGDIDVWSGPVDVAANKRVVIDIPNGVRKTLDWPRGSKLTSILRFTVGRASATVIVARPTAQLSATSTQLNCGDSSQLKWTSANAPSVQINNVGPVAANGDQGIQPKKTTTYDLTANGPGGTATSSTTVNVNTAIRADLQLTPGEVRYKRVGDKIVQQDTPALTWSASNASAVSIDALGTVDANGNRSLQVTPKKTTPGAVDETVTYILTATNECGGSETRTAALHITGAIEAEMALSRSVYFPTDLPRKLKTDDALLASERGPLKSLADAFNTYLSAQPDAHLVLEGHADSRGPDSYNQALSERRAELAKRFLIEQGVPEANLETNAYGKEQNLTEDQVKELLEQNPDLTAEERQKVMANIQTVVLANNRRVDIKLNSTGQESARMYPFSSTDYTALVDRGEALDENPRQNAAQKEKLNK
jgi:outer membrane protein OmpA-like peptidoglycan-associated protein